MASASQRRGTNVAKGAKGQKAKAKGLRGAMIEIKTFFFSLLNVSKQARFWGALRIFAQGALRL